MVEIAALIKNIYVADTEVSAFSEFCQNHFMLPVLIASARLWRLLLLISRHKTPLRHAIAPILRFPAFFLKIK